MVGMHVSPGSSIAAPIVTTSEALASVRATFKPGHATRASPFAGGYA